ncbi:MAG: hypothetical protein WAR79_15180, partial [Melioribacteraceae bacterium]
MNKMIIKLFYNYYLMLIVLLQLVVVGNANAQWEQSTINRGFVQQIDAVDNKIVVLCYGFNDNTQTIFYSENKGQDWTISEIDVNPNVLKIIDNYLF